MLTLITMMLTIGVAMAQESVPESNDEPAMGPALQIQVDCEGVTVEALNEVDEIAAGFLMDLEEDKLLALERLVISKLSCLDAPLTGSAAASLHGMTAMASMVDPQRDDVQVRAALYAAGLASALYELPADIPPTHRLRSMQSGAADYASAMDMLEGHGCTALVIDGVIGRSRRIGAPAIAQCIGEDGTPTSTIYYAPAISFNGGGEDEE